MTHRLIIEVMADNRRHSFSGNSTHGAALVVAFREWLAGLSMPMAVGAEELEAEVVWSAAKERAGEAPGLAGSTGSSSAAYAIRHGHNTKEQQ